MPTFRAAPSTDLASSIRRAMQSTNLGPAMDLQADAAAASTAHNLGLAEKARAEVEAMQRAEADRTNPALATEYAGHAAGMNLPDASRLSSHIRGVLEQPGPGDVDDAMVAGKDAQPYVTGAPNVPEGQKRLFQSALAATIANRLGTGKTNAEQLAHAGDRLNETALAQQAADTTDVPTANRIIAAISGKIREPFKMNPQGVVLNEERGTIDEGSQLAGAVRRNLGAQAAQRQAAAGGEPGEPGAPTVALPKGADLMQEPSSGTKYAYNKNSGRAWKATDSGWEPILVTALPKNLNKVGAGGNMGNREAVFAQRVIQSGNQAAHDLHNVVQLPLEAASTGVFGGRKQGGSLFDATKEVLANKMTGQEVQSYNVMSTGFQRSLASIETQGLAPAGSLTHQMDAVLFKEGDTNLTKLHKLAQTRQIVESGMEVMLDNPRVSDEEKGRIRTVLDRITKAVPFTHEDLIKLDQAQKLDKNATLKSVMSAKGAPAAPAPVNAKGWKLMSDAKGNQAYVSPDGKQFEEVQ